MHNTFGDQGKFGWCAFNLHIKNTICCIIMKLYHKKQ